MEKYSRYKFSGEQWLGDIPEHWETRKAKYLFELITTPSDSSNKIGLENIESATGRFVKTENEFEGNGIAFQPNDIVYGKLRPYLQKVWLADFAGNAVGDVYVLRCNENIQPTFVKYVMLSYNFTVAADSSTYGAKMPRVSYEFIGNLKWGLPPLSEQRGIVSYLDRVTGGIDKAISHSERMIELLRERKQIIIQQAVTKGLNPNAKLKHSGVEWIGDIPEHWEIKPLKFIIQFISGFAFDSNEFSTNGDISVIRIGNIAEDKINYDNIAYVDKDKTLQPYLTQKGDMLIAMSGATTGKIGIDYQGGSYVNQRVGIIRSQYTKFIYYWLHTQIFKDYILFSSQGSAQPNISAKGIENFTICIPSKDEVDTIVNYLDKHFADINSAIASEGRKIELLRERKQIIINEAVTGKIKVI